MKIAIGNDHVAVSMKEEVIAHLCEKGYEVVNFGTDSTERTDYPIYGKRVAEAVASGECDFGILICGTGVGISLAANKVHGIRAVVCSEPYSAMLSRQHNNISRLSIGNRISNRFFPITDFHILAICFANTNFNIINNCLWFLKTWIIRSDNG